MNMGLSIDPCVPMCQYCLFKGVFFLRREKVSDMLRKLCFASSVNMWLSIDSCVPMYQYCLFKGVFNPRRMREGYGSRSVCE